MSMGFTAVIDYGIGNTGSIINMLKKAGTNAIYTSLPEEILSANRLILPGVGSFDRGMQNINDSGLVPVLEEAVIKNRIPVLGICLGMQMMVESSGEGKLPGLGWIKGHALRFNLSEKGLRVPHMGWNALSDFKKEGLFNNMEDAEFYFAHSYHVVCERQENVIAKCFYGHDFTAAFLQKNIFGVQFHPEKSHKFGLNLLKNFISDDILPGGL